MRRLIPFASFCTLLTMIAVAPTGCGPAAKPTVNVKGTVTFKGKPVAVGFINFMPDVVSGEGAIKVFEIVDGVYDTSKGPNPGVTPGPTKIMISGFDGKKVNQWPKGKQIFNPIELKETVAAGTKDYIVPDSAGQNVRIVPTADPDSGP